MVVHPALVHFPLAMLFAAWVCLLVLHRTRDDAWDARVRLFEVVGVATTPLVILTGFLDDAGVIFDLDPGDPVLWHALAAIAASTTFAGHWQWRRTRPTAGLVGRVAVIDVTWATAATWLFVLTGLLGGEMVHA